MPAGRSNIASAPSKISSMLEWITSRFDPSAKTSTSNSRSIWMRSFPLWGRIHELRRASCGVSKIEFIQRSSPSNLFIGSPVRNSRMDSRGECMRECSDWTTIKTYQGPSSWEFEPLRLNDSRPKRFLAPQIAAPSPVRRRLPASSAGRFSTPWVPEDSRVRRSQWH